MVEGAEIFKPEVMVEFEFGFLDAEVDNLENPKARRAIPKPAM